MKDASHRFGLFIQVGAVGAMGAAIQACLLFVLVQFARLHPVLANTIAAETAIICNFMVNNAWTFRHESMHSLPRRFALFNLGLVGSISVQALVVWAGVHFIGIQWYLLYAGAGILLGLIINYALYTRVIWRKPPQEAGV
ncbi:MAG TPA: GtrA family protein [Candidatus Paceibacterota bacterium]|nr:GtrA family protein [Candidatus Paceibacterota bacterium]